MLLLLRSTRVSEHTLPHRSLAAGKLRAYYDDDDAQIICRWVRKARAAGAKFPGKLFVYTSSDIVANCVTVQIL